MALKYYYDLEQGSDEWFALRCGVLTASEMDKVVTPTFKPASNEKERKHVYELLAQRVTKYVEPSYVGDAMLRGRDDEVEAKIAYDQTYGEVTDCGFITNDKWGFVIGYSPDGLVGSAGQLECKSRRQGLQMETLATCLMPDEFLLQVQTGLMVSEREWCDFISYSGGMKMLTLRVYPDAKIHAAILQAAVAFEQRIETRHDDYLLNMTDHKIRTIATVRRIEKEIVL